MFLDGLTLLVDGEQYGTVDPGEGFYNEARQHAVPHAAQWLKGNVMAPLDRTVSGSSYLYCILYQQAPLRYLKNHN